MNAGRGQQGTSPWVFVGCGCGLAVLLIGLALGGLAYFGYQGAKQFEADMKDPAARTDRVLEILGAEDLPEGYHAVMGMSVPLVMDIAILSDREPGPEGEMDDLGSGRRCRLIGARQEQQIVDQARQALRLPHHPVAYRLPPIGTRVSASRESNC